MCPKKIFDIEKQLVANDCELLGYVTTDPVSVEQCMGVTIANQKDFDRHSANRIVLRARYVRMLSLAVLQDGVTVTVSNMYHQRYTIAWECDTNNAMCQT